MDKEQGIRFTNPHQQSKSTVWDNQRNWAQQQGKTAPYGKEHGVTYPPWYLQRNYAQQQGKTVSYGKERGVSYALWHQQLNFAAKIQLGFFRKIGSECTCTSINAYHHHPISRAVPRAE